MRNLFSLAIIFCCLTFTSCKSQENITINYEARTRGYHYKLSLNKNLLDIIKNSDKKNIELSKNQIDTIANILTDINFSEIQNNTSTDNFANDSSIPINMSILFKEKEYIFNFDSANIPLKINELMLKLTEFSKE
ncbi:hypothetical protein R3X25_05545 [Lutibacter sp. TH_r2]|uniref:hypothetical protein n=1 Tax=Lutibacter sp. TH_r2 TaxID=3082083 RepID=UPI002954EB8A|nr:hypothetical protein [Lutibacter sp. TH_r2]MDV7186739.1 hypothetical protein [Lutibacter sp. TH_r2]